jgi:hypothetical protein
MQERFAPVPEMRSGAWPEIPSVTEEAQGNRAEGGEVMGEVTRINRARWWLQWAYIRVLGALARKAFCACDHGNTIVLDMTRPYPMCALCIQEAIGEFHASLMANEVKITDDVVESAFHLYCAGGKNASSMKDALEDYEAHRPQSFTLEQVRDAMDDEAFSISEIEGVINRLTPPPSHLNEHVSLI